MIKGIYYKKIILRGLEKTIYKGFLIYYKNNVYALYNELYKHDIWKYFK